MTTTVRLEHRDARPLAVVRRTARLGELPRVIPEACGVVWNLARTHGVRGAGRHVALYLDDVFHLEIGVELAEPFGGASDLLASATPAGLVATVLHVGPYAGLSRAHAEVKRWCAERGHVLAGPSWELYGHWLKEWDDDPSKIETEVCYLVAPDGPL